MSGHLVSSSADVDFGKLKQGSIQRVCLLFFNPLAEIKSAHLKGKVKKKKKQNLRILPLK